MSVAPAGTRRAGPARRGAARRLFFHLPEPRLEEPLP